MRTTIDLSDEQRSLLLAMAGKRRLRGYSLLVQEALAQYLHLPKPKGRPGRRKIPPESGSALSFFSDGFSTGRRDGAESHDDYIYRSR